MQIRLAFEILRHNFHIGQFYRLLFQYSSFLHFDAKLYGSVIFYLAQLIVCRDLIIMKQPKCFNSSFECSASIVLFNAKCSFDAMFIFEVQKTVLERSIIVVGKQWIPLNGWPGYFI